MNIKILIPLVIFSLLPAGFLIAQEFYTSLNNYNRILINPSYAGFKYESNICTSYSVFVKSKDELFNEFNLTYDRYAPKLKGGTAFIFKQGLQADMNTNTLELGFIYSPRIKKFKSIFYPSVYIGFQKPIKNWFVYGFDEWRNSFEIYQNIPGKIFLRHGIYKIGFGALVVLDNVSFGMSGNYGFQQKKDEKIISSKSPYKLLLHFTKTTSKNKNGILSRARHIKPELIMHFENGLFQTKSEIRIIGRKYSHSFFMLNNFSDNIHNIGGSAGFENQNFQVIISSSFGSTVKLNRLTNHSSVSFIFKLPKENIRKTYPFKPFK